jgi:uncharacterized protein YbaP (TraB family)
VFCFLIHRRRNHWVTLLVSAIFSVSSIGHAAENSSTKKHFLWRVTNVSAPFYLLGSLHALRRSDYPLPVEIEQAINNSRQVIFETNPDARDTPPFKRKLRKAGYYPNGVTIAQKVSAKTFAYLKRVADVRLSQYENFKPWAIAFFMVRDPGLEDFSSRLSVDRYVYTKARGRTEIGGLETTDDSVAAFANMSDSESEAFLLDILAYARRSPQLLIETTALWKSGDVERMYWLYASGGMATSPGYFRWLERRQLPWIPRIEAALKSGKPTTVVVGSLHLCGPHSIIALLRARGYKIEQL